MVDSIEFEGRIVVWNYDASVTDTAWQVLAACWLLRKFVAPINSAHGTHIRK